MRTLFKIGLFIAAAAVVTAVAVTVAAQPRETPAPRERTGDERFEVEITPEMRQHTRIRQTLYFVGIAYSAAVLALVLVTGLSRRMRDLAARAADGRFYLTAVLYLVMFIVVVHILEFPLSYYSGFVVPHQFDLTDQSFGAWIADDLKGLRVVALITPLVGALALLALRRVRRWWLALWLGSIPFILLLVVITPVLLDPIFNKYEPLKDEVLKTKLLDLASRAGIEGGRVFEVDKSKQTKTLNAYVTGIGPTKRIVLWDTIIARMTHDELIGVMGHEMGHYVLNHLWKGLGFTTLLSVILFFLLQWLYDRVSTERKARWGIEGSGDPASVPLLLLIGSLIGFFLTPVGAAYSRQSEHEADIFALELTRKNEDLATAFVKLAEESKVEPNPPAIIKYWRYTHPPIAERIPFALSYKPWEEGKPNQLVK